MKKPGKPPLPAASSRAGRRLLESITHPSRHRDVGRAVHGAQVEHRDKDSTDKHA